MDCRTFKTFEGTPRRFKLAVGTEESKFNHRVIVDTMFIENRPNIHLVYGSTHFTADAFFRNQTTTEIWKPCFVCEIMRIMTPPDFLAVDQVSVHILREMKETLAASGVTIDKAPIETRDPSGLSRGTMRRFALALTSSETP